MQSQYIMHGSKSQYIIESSGDFLDRALMMCLYEVVKRKSTKHRLSCVNNALGNTTNAVGGGVFLSLL